MAFLEDVLESFRSGKQQYRAYDRPEQRSSAAQHGDDGNLNGNIDSKNAVRNNELERAAVKSAGQRGKKRAHEERMQFAASRVNADRGRSVFVFTDGHEVISKTRARGPIVREERDYRQCHGGKIERSPECPADEESGHGQANSSA